MLIFSHSFFLPFFHFYTVPCNSGRVLWFHVGCSCVCLSVPLLYVRPSVRLYFHFRMITWVNINGFFTKLSICINIVEIRFGIANVQISSVSDRDIRPRHFSNFRFWTIISVSIEGFSQGLGMCIDIMRIWFGIANRQISSIFDRVSCPWHVRGFVSDNNLSKCQRIFMKLDVLEICFRIAIRQMYSIFDWQLCALDTSVFSFLEDTFP